MAIEKDDVKSLYSEQEQLNADTVFTNSSFLKFCIIF